jgi:cytochrome c5
MDVGNAGYGAGGGILSALLVWAGFKQRLDRADKDISDTRIEIAELKKAVVFRDTCQVCHEASLREMASINTKLDTIIKRLP